MSWTNNHRRAVSRGDSAQRAFTIIELLVVIAVIALLVTLIVSIATQAYESQRQSNTRGIMRGVELAIDQFSTEDPLKLVYNRPKNTTFGPYPPYAVYGNPNPDSHSVASLLEPDRMANSDLETLAGRLARDLGRTSATEIEDWVVIADWNSWGQQTRLYDDNRALMAYLAAFAPATLTQIPSNALKPLAPKSEVGDLGEFVNARGAAKTANDDGHRQILGVYDAWGVPLDYFLAIRVEWSPEARNGAGGFRIVERAPMLRSLGVDREVYDSRVEQGYFPPKDWIFSREMAGPFAGMENETTGVLDSSAKRSANGWLRGVARVWDDENAYNGREKYGYRPDDDRE